MQHSDEQSAAPVPDVESSSSTDRLNDAMRAWAAAFGDMGRQFALHLGIHSSDATALVQITAAEDRDAPLTQTQLARRIGLTTPATSSLLNRLEDAGHVQRHRSRADRRVVTLRSTQAMHDEVHRFFRDIGDDVDRVASTQPDATLDLFTSVVQEMTQVMNRHLQTMIDRRP